MSPIAIGVLAVSMSIDAFIASLGRGAQARHPSVGTAVRTGMVFGTVETLTPLIGWGLGVAARQHVAVYDHWIAFVLLAGVGTHMMMQSFSAGEEGSARRASSPWTLLAVAIGTSIDAMAVGISLAFLDVNILVIALAIGATSAAMSSAGTLAGRFLGRRFGRVIEAFGGLALIGLGAVILAEHLLSR